MEQERVEMSVGGGAPNGIHVANGVTINGSTPPSNLPAEESQSAPSNALSVVNGVAKDDAPQDAFRHLQDATPQFLEMLSTEFYLPMTRLVSRGAQECWNDLMRMVEKLSKLPVQAQTTTTGLLPTNDQSKVNLDKKAELLNFAQKHKAVFIKLLVLLAWSKDGEKVRKTIELNYWISQRRGAFINATVMIGQMMQDLASSQVPNPDLYTAAEVLALGKASKLPDLGYVPQQLLSPSKILSTLKRLDNVLCTRLALETDIPSQMRQFHVHDGRVTFRVPGAFELDLSLLDDVVQDSKFLMVDLRFLFSPSPSIPDALHDEISFVTNSAIEKDGLPGAYNFIHDLTLSYKLNELHKQARELAQGLWAGHLKVEMLRRTVVVQYWLKRRGPKSWLEIGVGSGRRSHSARPGAAVIPELQVRWLREGRLVEAHHIVLDQAQISFEDTLRQVIAHHVGNTFDAIYDRLVQLALYADAELELNLAASNTDPGECSLDIQLSQTDSLHVNIEPVSGTVILGPVSERTNRVQEELSRSRNLTDDFVERVSTLRCAIVESNLLRMIVNSTWQHLPGLKLNHAEMSNLFSQNVSRASFFRQSYWTSSWMLAVTQSPGGDHWWLTKQLDKNGGATPRITQVIRSRPLHLEGPTGPAYLERLANYTSGLIMLQTNAQHLNERRIAYTLPAMPNFSRECRLPALRFERHPRSIPGADRTGSCIQREVELSYHNSGPELGGVVMIARARFTLEATNLEELAASRLDRAVSISPRSRQVMIRVVAGTGTPVTDEVISKLNHVDNIVACAATVKRSSFHTLKSLSLSALTISYNADRLRDLSLVIHFATEAHDLRVEFLPADDNPHQHMATFVTRMLVKPGQSLSKSLEDVLALLKMTQPLMTYLNNLQNSGRSGIDVSKAQESNNSKDLVRVHILPRQAASYAIHYFSTSGEFPRDVSGAPPKLLVRLEVLPTTRGRKAMWVVRPAIEEFASYTRPSFTSTVLREKMKRDVFRQENGNWLRLDEGAAVSAEHPDRLLSAIHGCIVDWLAEALSSSEVIEQNQSTKVNGAPNKSGKGDTQPPVPPASRLGVIQKASGRPNGTSMPPSNQRSTPLHHNNMKNAMARREVITLE